VSYGMLDAAAKSVNGMALGSFEDRIEFND
jgi:hypothetical protein